MIKKDQIIKIIEDMDINVKVEDINFSKPLKEIGLDSLDVFNLISEVETIYDKKISDDIFEKIGSLNDLLKFLNSSESV